MTMQAEPIRVTAPAEGRLSSAIPRALLRHRLLLTLVALHLAAALAVSAWTGMPFRSGTIPTLVIALKVLIPCFVMALLAYRFVYMALRVRPKRPTQWLINDIRQTALDPDRLASGIIAFLAVSVMAGTFAYLKDMVPVLNPFSWDPTFAAWDRALHGGNDPWRVLLPITGTPLVTTILNAAYHFWFFLLYFLVFMTCFDKANVQRNTTFLVAFVLSWMLGGNLLAILFASGGPVYFEALGHGDTFAPQLAMLHDFAQISPVWALDVHAMLWDGYTNDGPVRGISAMPSMHVGSSVIMALFGFAYARWLGWVLTAFTGLIIVGSVHLAWHYAVDAYVGIAIAFVCWWMAKMLAKRFA